MSALEPTAVLRSADRSHTDASRWVDDACAVDSRVLARAVGPVLDVGCGPGRHVAELVTRGVDALGIDITPAALEAARVRGVTVLERSVFDEVPRAGEWATVLLLDGNIGIGGDPVRLLRRAAELLAPGGSIIAEATPPGDRRPAELVSLEVMGVDGPGFWLATVCADTLARTAAEAGLVATEVWQDGSRWFGVLQP